MRKKEHSAAYVIFHYYYRCYIPQSYLYSPDHIKEYGIMTSEDRNIDRALAQSQTLTRQTIAEMAELFDRGATITLEDPSQSAEIYTVLNEHLVTWVNQVQSVNATEAPMQDLRKLEALAMEIYGIAKHYLKEAPGTNTLFKGLKTLEGRRGMSRISGVRESVTLPDQHTAVTEVITKENFRRGRKWQ